MKNHKSTFIKTDDKKARKIKVEQLIKEAPESTEQVFDRVKQPVARVSSSSSTFLREFLAKPFNRQLYHERYRELARMIPKDRAALFIIQNRRLFLDNDEQSRKELGKLFLEEFGVDLPKPTKGCY